MRRRRLLVVLLAPLIVPLVIGVLMGIAMGVTMPLTMPLTGAGASQILRSVPVWAHWPFPMVISPNGRYLATATNARADAVELYDFKTGRRRVLTTTGVNQFYEYRMSSYAMAFSPDSKTLAHGGAEMGSYSAINTWDTATGAHRKTFAFTTVGTGVLFTPDGKHIVAAAKDNRVHLWDAKTGRAIKTIPALGSPIVSLALSPDGRRVAIGGVAPACRVQVRDLRSGRAVWDKPVASPEGTVTFLAFSPDGKTLARGGQRNNIYLHDARTGRLRATLSDPVPAHLRNGAGGEAARVVAYSPDGRFLAGGGISRVVVWATRTNQVVLRPGQAEQAGIPLAFLPDSRALAAALSDRRVTPHRRARSGNVAIWRLK